MLFQPGTLDARRWVKKLGLKKHPEGGYFKEVFRSEKQVTAADRDGPRSALTSIYYLLGRGEFSAFHRIKSDELWHFLAGSSLVLQVIYDDRLEKITLGKGHRMQASVRAGKWFSAATAGSYSLVACTVAPGFDFADWEIGSRDDLVKMYPQHRKIIVKYTRK